MITAATPERLSWPRRIGWAVGDLGINFYWQGITIFGYFFYTDVMGITPYWAGVAYAVASFWDAAIDPVIGAVADRTRTRWGRFRPWLLFGSVPVGFAFALMYWTPPLAGAWLIAYAIATHILLRTLLACVGIPFGALSARLTHDSNERGVLAALRVVFAATGALIVAFTVPKFVALFDQPQRAYFWAAVSLGCGATIILVLTFFSTHEVQEGPEDGEAASARARGGIVAGVVRDVADFWMTLRHNGPLQLLFAVFILGGISGMFYKITLYWITYDLQQPAAMVWILPLPALVLLPCAPPWNWLARRTSKRNAFLLGQAINLAALLAFYVLNPHDTRLLAVILVVAAIGASAGPIMFWSMLPDTVEYNELKRGVRSEAKIFGFAAFALKIAMGINALLLGQLLTRVGFVANQPQSAQTLEAMLAIMCLVPLAGGIVAMLVMWKYPIDARFHAQLRADIAARKAVEASALAPP
jgi:GPH family glycoside/pentoside/hexuronide:cation symporter